ncbi:hypothetical protein ABPG72_015991 [Tetrahymena utriculariae]
MEKNENKYHRILIDPSNSIEYYTNHVLYDINYGKICLCIPKSDQFQQQLNILQTICFQLQNVSFLKLEIFNQLSPEEDVILLKILSQFSCLQSFCLDQSRCKQIINFENILQQSINTIKKLFFNIKSSEINDQIIINLSNQIMEIKDLQNLDLCITENSILYENSYKQFFRGLSKQKNLEQIKIDINSLNSLNLQNQFIETLKTYQNLKILDLKFHQIQGIHGENNQNIFIYLREMIFMEYLKLNFQGLYGKEDKYDNIGKSLENMKQLNYLDLNISQQVTSICLHEIGKSLVNLKNIKNLKLSLLTNYSYVDSFNNGINSLCNLEELILQIRKREIQKNLQQEQSQLQKEVACIKNLSQLKIFNLQLNSLTVHQINVSKELVDIFQSAQNLSLVSLDFNYRISDELCVLAQALCCLKHLTSFKLNFIIQTSIKEEKIIQFLELIGQIQSLEVLELRIFKIQNIHLLYFSKGFQYLFSLKKFVFFLQTVTKDDYIQDLFKEIKHLANLKELVLNVMPNSFSCEVSKILSESLNKLNYIQNITLGIVISEIITLESVKNIKNGLKNHKELNIFSAYLIDDLEDELENNQLKTKSENLFKKHLIRLVSCKFS